MACRAVLQCFGRIIVVRVTRSVALFSLQGTKERNGTVGARVLFGYFWHRAPRNAKIDPPKNDFLAAHSGEPKFRTKVYQVELCL